jgi:hypothetical protein
VNTVATIVGTDGEKYLGDLGSLLNDHYYPTEYAQEIMGCAQAMDVPYGWVALLNLGYEVSDACTSIVAQTTDGKILHGRNLDFWAGMGFTDTLKNMTLIANYQKSGKTVFQATTFAGYVGVLSDSKIMHSQLPLIPDSIQVVLESSSMRSLQASQRKMHLL